MENDYVDRISYLPEFILHDILSFLPREDAARTSVLSKKWNCVWESFPILDFDQCTYLKTPLFRYKPSTPLCPEQVGNFLNGVKNSLMRFCLRKQRAQKFRLRTIDLDPNLASKFVECLELALKSGAIVVDLHLTPPQPLSGYITSPIKYYSLQKLKLFGICLSEKSIQDIVHSCPNIRSLHLGNLRGLKKFAISKLDRLEVVVIMSSEFSRVDIDAPNLRDFDFCLVFGKVFPCTIINLTSRGLRKFSLDKSAITDELFHLLLSSFPFLEDLRIGFCNMLQRVRISAQYLRNLYFHSCYKIEAFEIDAPALTSFRYSAETLPPLFSKSIPSELEIVSMLQSFPVNTNYFLNLREFLAVSTLRDFLTLIVDTRQVIFDLEELRQVAIPPAFQVALLKLEFFMEDELGYGPTLIDGLLWSCHPKTISVPSGTIAENSFIKILCERLLAMEKYPSCCDCSHIKCWRHDLKSARIDSFGGVLDSQQLANWNLLLDKLPSDARGPVICFRLEWD